MLLNPPLRPIAAWALNPRSPFPFRRRYHFSSSHRRSSVAPSPKSSSWLSLFVKKIVLDKIEILFYNNLAHHWVLLHVTIPPPHNRPTLKNGICLVLFFLQYKSNPPRRSNLTALLEKGNYSALFHQQTQFLPALPAPSRPRAFFKTNPNQRSAGSSQR